MNNIKKTTRFLAMELLVNIREKNTYSNIGLNQVIKKENLSKKDAAFLTNLVYGVLQHRLTLEYYLKAFVNKPKKIDPWVNELLLLSIYQMKYLDKIPMHAIFNEAIEIAKYKGHAGTRKFVTGVLHAIKRKGLPGFGGLSVKERLSVEQSVPQWIIDELSKTVGLEKTTKIMQSINVPPHESLRVNTKQISSAKLQEKLEKEKIKTHPSLLAADGLIADSGFLAGTKSFMDGDFIIQDESAMLVGETMDVKADQIILDACSAPGGKTTQIASALEKGKVYALDIHSHKLKLVQQNAQRMKVADQVITKKLDARKTVDEFGEEYFDQILVDAPCSGIGLMRRKPEIKYEKTLQDSLNLAEIQLSILDAVAPALKKGGKLTYSTCTILSTENQSVVERFLEKHSEFEQVKTQTTKKIKNDRNELGLTIYPDDFDSDGFFIATLIKK